MATSSIFADFTIKDKETADRFVAAFEASSSDGKRIPTTHVNPPLTDPNEIRALFSKRKVAKRG